MAVNGKRDNSATKLYNLGRNKEGMGVGGDVVVPSVVDYRSQGNSGV